MVAECSQQLDVDIIDANSKLFAKAIATRSAFVPYQKTKSSLKIHMSTPISSPDPAMIHSSIPVPLLMERSTENPNVLNLTFQTPADTKAAFKVLRAKGLNLESTADFLLWPVVPPWVNRPHHPHATHACRRLLLQKVYLQLHHYNRGAHAGSATQTPAHHHDGFRFARRSPLTWRS